MLKLPTLKVSRREAKAHIGERIKEGRRYNSIGDSDVCSAAE
jgi:hypothetical protein